MVHGKKMRGPVPGLTPWFLLLGLGIPSAGMPAQEPPAIVALTLDTSGSISPGLLAQTRELALGVLQSLPQGSEVALFTFDDQSRRILDRTGDAEAVKQALAGVNRAGRYTALYDALYDASKYLKQAPRSRKAIVLITDGKDENSALQVEDGLKVAVENHIPVYAVGVGRVEENVLRRIAKLTAGEYLPMAPTASAAIAARVQELALPEVEAPPVAPARPAPVTAAPAGPSLTWLYLVLGLAAIVAGVVIGMRLRRPAVLEAPGHSVPPGASSASGAASGLSTAEREDSTVVMRNPGLGYVEKTVMLRMRPSLTITRGAQIGQVFNLSAESAVSIGRAPTNDIALNDNAVSGEHCRVRPEAGAFVVHDLKSTNGTFVNDKRVSRHALSEGDVIRVGETLLEFKLDSTGG